MKGTRMDKLEITVHTRRNGWTEGTVTYSDGEKESTVFCNRMDMFSYIDMCPGPIHIRWDW